MVPCARSSPTLYSVLVVLTVILVRHQWPAVYAAAATASKGAAKATASKDAASAKRLAPAVENDTAVVGSDVHLAKVAPSDDDLLPAGSKKFVDDFLNGGGDKFAGQGFRKSHHSSDGDGYAKHDTFHARDGDSFGYGQHFAFDKKRGDKDGDGYHEDGGAFHNDHDDHDDDGDDAASSVSSVPKFGNQWSFAKAANPSGGYRYEGDSDDYGAGKLVGPEYDETKGSASRRSKRKKEPHPSATEYDNYEYADVEEPEDAPADFEAEEPDPEYGQLYADADAYDYY